MFSFGSASVCGCTYASTVGATSSSSRRGAEVSLKQLFTEDRVKFAASGAKEWHTIINTGAARVLSHDESCLVRRRTPYSIISSRMVRRLRPQEGIGAPPKAKSR